MTVTNTFNVDAAKLEQRGLDSYGFDFLEDLTTAIMDFARAHEERNPREFTYEGMDLQYALQKYLYFTHMWSERFYREYARSRAGLPFDLGEPGDEIDRYLLEHLTGKNQVALIRSNTKQQSVFRKLLNNIRNVSRKREREAAAYFVYLRDYMNRAFTESCELLVLVNQSKFVRYLLPVLESLDKKIIITSTEEIKWEHQLPENIVLQTIDNVKLPDHLPETVTGLQATLCRWLPKYAMVFDALIAAVRPEKVILAEGNAPMDEIISKVAQRKGVPTLCIQHGWGPVLTPEFRNMSYTKFLSWGRGFSELLEPYCPDQEFVSVGNYVLTPPDKTGSGSSNEKKAITFFLQCVTKLITRDIWDDFLNFTCWTAKTFPDREILVREHPSFPLDSTTAERLDRYPNLSLVPPARYTLEEVLQKSFLSVAVYSSTILESIAYGVIPLIYNVTSMKRYFPDIDKEAAGIEVASYREGKEKLEKLLTDYNYRNTIQKGMEQFKKKYFHSFGEQSIQNIVTEINR